MGNSSLVARELPPLGVVGRKISVIEWKGLRKHKGVDRCRFAPAVIDAGVVSIED
jgi:hypothetical protein